MSYVEKHLLESNENVVYRSSLHWIVVSRLIFLSLLGFSPVTLILLSTDTKVLALFPAGLAVIIIFASHIIRKSSEFTITDKRLIIKVGLINIETFQIFSPMIEGVFIEQSMLGRLLNYGNVVIIGIDGTKKCIKSINSPLEFSRMIHPNVNW